MKPVKHNISRHSLALSLSLSPALLPTFNGKKDTGDWEVKTRKIEIPNDKFSGF